MLEDIQDLVNKIHACSTHQQQLLVCVFVRACPDLCTHQQHSAYSPNAHTKKEHQHQHQYSTIWNDCVYPCESTPHKTVTPWSSVTWWWRYCNTLVGYCTTLVEVLCIHTYIRSFESSRIHWKVFVTETFSVVNTTHAHTPMIPVFYSHSHTRNATYICTTVAEHHCCPLSANGIDF